MRPSASASRLRWPVNAERERLRETEYLGEWTRQAEVSVAFPTEDDIGHSGIARTIDRHSPTL